MPMQRQRWKWQQEEWRLGGERPQQHFVPISIVLLSQLCDRDSRRHSCLPPPFVYLAGVSLSLSLLYIMEHDNLCQGPIDDTLLVLQRGHRSRVIWEANGRGSLESTTIIVRRCERELRALPSPSPPILKLIKQAGFFGLLNMQYMQLDLALLTALVERWRPETHTFHFPSGETTVTLQDVEVITGLPIDGKPVIGRTDLDWAQMVEELLGIRLEDGAKKRGHKVTLQWLRENFNGQVGENDTQVQIEQKARGYIMQLIGGVLAPDQSSSRVHLCYLDLLRDLTIAGQYSWGSACLASLYQGLCHISAADSKDVGGMFVLLQVWAWERLPYLAPGRVGDRPPREGAALFGRWHDKFRSPDLATHVVGHYRHSLDMQRPDEVIWQPYSEELIESLPPFCRAGRHIWRAKVPLINFNVVEMHQPDRVMRQFGYRQVRPEGSQALDRSHSMTMRKSTRDWAVEHAVHIAMWNDRLQLVVPEGLPDILGAYPDSDDYVTWYKRITVPFVSQMSASLDKATKLFRSLIQPELAEDVQEVGRQGLLCMAAQEKFLRKDPPVHGVWNPPAVVEDRVEDEGNARPKRRIRLCSDKSNHSSV
ncbi:hypothetical protein Vadar_007853 [Vaccinium darrowii]|uniref:Uncharacterized protein n=1 Tax=Vaccinium darrowii TaxID=229202 RepID=A0ACB7Y6Z9_9ERIC|nr:hypothetical protein Vadar_007853 [Vaccinium darrowii]